MMRDWPGRAVGLLVVCLAGAGCYDAPTPEVNITLWGVPGMIRVADVTTGYVNISPEELKKKIDAREDFSLIDVRPATLYEAGHLPGALSMPLATLASAVIALPREKETVIYCQTGLMSVRAANILTEAGFSEVKSLVGGIAAWPYELVTGSAITVSL